MIWYPQIGSGSLAQFPLTRSRNWRAIRNELESGERIILPDNFAGQIEWRLPYQGLSDAETQLLNDFYTASKGSYGTFSFADPLTNLLAWSEDLTKPDWQPGLISSAGGATDSEGGKRAFMLTNAAPGGQQLTQTIGIPGSYVACFSLWVRSDSPATVVLQRDSAQLAVEAGGAWKRVYIGGVGAGGASSSAFSIQLSAGQTVQVWGFQVEAQPYPSQYKVSTVSAGIYEETYFATDELTFTNTAPGLSSCDIRLLSRV